MNMEMIQAVMESCCLSKANLSEEEANNIIDKVLMDEGLLLYYYKCPFCRSHHLTRSIPGTTIEKLEVR
jgi:hypothetical protein